MTFFVFAFKDVRYLPVDRLFYVKKFPLAIVQNILQRYSEINIHCYLTQCSLLKLF